MDVRELVERVLETVNGNQAELARRLGRSETTVSRWANGRTGIDFESALRIARMTGLPPRQVLISAGLDADLFPVAGSDQADLAVVAWNALYYQMDADTRLTVVPMVRAAVNLSETGTVNPPGARINRRKTGRAPDLKSQNRRFAGVLVAICSPFLRRPQPSFSAATA